MERAVILPDSLPVIVVVDRQPPKPGRQSPQKGAAMGQLGVVECRIRRGRAEVANQNFVVVGDVLNHKSLIANTFHGVIQILQLHAAELGHSLVRVGVSGDLGQGIRNLVVVEPQPG